MSLLIKALNKAEQEKRSEAEAGAEVKTSSLELAPMEPDLEAEAGFTDAEPAQQAARRADEGKARQRAAGVVFATKANGSRVDATTLMIAGGAVLLLLVAGGFYFYLQSLQPVPVMPMRVAEKASVPAPQAQETLLAEERVVEDAEVVGEFVQEAVPEPEAQTAAAELPPPADLGFSLEAAATTRQADGSAETLRKPSSPALPETLSQPQPDTSPARELKVTINNPLPMVNPDLEAAYMAFQAGDDAAAQAAYRKVLQTDVRNVDALLGMAAVAMRQGRSNDAMGWYGRVLEIEPRNSYAQAAMADLLAQADPASGESRLKSLIALRPESAHLYAALGNIYAERKDWLQAQQAYFEAHRLDSANPEHVFNLAVSLDQLGKATLALQYYRQTLEMLGKRNVATIDRAALESRIAQLQ